ncbi:bile acid:sodium symporter family protein [Photobacterium sp. TLY01]|uniref:bile acid:sodium symporter family protein n=1 Tax=Photobacterium sp. TLY01 TaxID=2907534 RepID=UPI001F21F922|nr:bile acid:sodium symporter family protein [Photobacterium sp. TLY01]UIP28136.1 bile acid:sodium symporter family protein [Photobacterium sp. TLY01]
MSSTSLLLLNLILAMMMFGIALSLKPADFRQVIRQPKGPLTGLAAQFVLMPALTWLLTLLVPMPAEVALGLILVASCPGGSFSNIVTYLAKGNTAMSISMTGIASVAAAFMTPFNFMFYAGMNPQTAQLLKQIAVPPESLLMMVALVLALPLALGLICSQIAPGFAKRSEPFFRIISLLTLFSFVAIALVSNWPRFIAGASVFLLAVIVHNALALGIGWLCARVMKLPVADRRAITLEVGLQNSGLGLGIIFTFFGDLTGMAIIAAGWGIWHLISGMGLCYCWHRLDHRHAALTSPVSSTREQHKGTL